ncbi:MAG: tetratricopeptide repeat protein [Leptospiraceae bacterium]|nr:tetratricopeptide repeat protein [Leptospiraceae bacterium]
MKKTLLFLGIFFLIAAVGVFFATLLFYLPEKKAEALLRKGKLYLEQESQEALRQAIEQFTTVLSEYPNSRSATDAQYFLAQTYEKLNLKDIAFGKYKKLLEQKLSGELEEEVKFKLAKLQILRSYTEEGKTALLLLLNNTKNPKLRSEIYTEIGKIYAREGKQAEAQRNYQIALSEYAENREARLLLAKTLKEQKKDSQAFGVYEEYLTFQAPLEGDRQQVAQSYRKEILDSALKQLQQQNFTEAIKNLQFVSERFPDTDEAEDALYFLGNAYLKQKNYVAALKAFNDAVSNKPRHRDEASYIKKGETYYYRKDYKKAAAMFQYVQKNYPKSKYYQIAKDWEEEALRSMHEELSHGEAEEDEISQEKSQDSQESKEVLSQKTQTPPRLVEQNNYQEIPRLEDSEVVP